MDGWMDGWTVVLVKWCLLSRTLLTSLAIVGCRNGVRGYFLSKLLFISSALPSSNSIGNDAAIYYVGTGRGRGGGGTHAYQVVCMTIVVLARDPPIPLHCRDGARQVFTDQADIACIKREAP